MPAWSRPGRLLLPVPPDRRPLRAAVLVAGLALYGASVALLLRSGLGVMPWTVLDEGLATTVGGRVGTWSIATGAAVLLCWLPLRQRPGAGTLANVVLVGASVDAVTALVPPAAGPGAAWSLLLAGVLLNGVATGLYVGAGLGPGPRDGLSLGLAARGVPLRLARTGVEVLVLLVGLALGGTVGWGTLVYALAIGPLVHRAVPALALRPARPGRPTTGRVTSGTAPG